MARPSRGRFVVRHDSTAREPLVRKSALKALRGILWALLISLLVGFAVGTTLRLRLERPIRYIGSAIAPRPFDVGDPRAAVLDARHHEEQIG